MLNGWDEQLLREYFNPDNAFGHKSALGPMIDRLELGTTSVHFEAFTEDAIIRRLDRLHDIREVKTRVDKLAPEHVAALQLQYQDGRRMPKTRISVAIALATMRAQSAYGACMLQLKRKGKPVMDRQVWLAWLASKAKTNVRMAEALREIVEEAKERLKAAETAFEQTSAEYGEVA